jgi:hypothetical protein
MSKFGHFSTLNPLLFVLDRPQRSEGQHYVQELGEQRRKSLPQVHLQQDLPAKDGAGRGLQQHGLAEVEGVLRRSKPGVDVIKLLFLQVIYPTEGGREGITYGFNQAVHLVVSLGAYSANVLPRYTPLQNYHTA